jgi:hypothetical protein
MGANRAWLRERRAFSRGVHSAIVKDAATYTEECKEEGLNTALQLLTDYLNAVPEATTVRRPWDK